METNNLNTQQLPNVMREHLCIVAQQSDGNEMVIFEGYRHIPFFWLLLVEQNDVPKFYEAIKQYQQIQDAQTPQNQSVTTTRPAIGLDKIQALIRAADRRDYVKKYYEPCLPLYDDWLYFMQISDFADMKIYIDIFDICSHHLSLESAADSLKKAIACFDEDREAWYDHAIEDTCGYDRNNKNVKKFSNTSKAYDEINKRFIYSQFEAPVLRKKKS
jgi:hypothetical protein